MDSKTVNRELRAAIRPVLRTHGFKLFTERTAWRHSPGRVDVIGFQSFNDYRASLLGATTYSFAVSLGQWLTCVPPDDFNIKSRDGLLAPKDWECQLHLPLTRRLSQPELYREDIWYIDAGGSYLVPAIRDARTVLLDVGLAWFDRNSNDEALLQRLHIPPGEQPDGTRIDGDIGSVSRDIVLGYVKLSLGRRREGYETLRHALTRIQESDAKRPPSRSTYIPPAWNRLRADVGILAVEFAPAP